MWFDVLFTSPHWQANKACDPGPSGVATTGGAVATGVGNNAGDTGEPCVGVLFPFMGTTYEGCMSETDPATGKFGRPYRECVPVFLKGGGFDFITPLVRLAATVAIGYGLYKAVK